MKRKHVLLFAAAMAVAGMIGLFAPLPGLSTYYDGYFMNVLVRGNLQGGAGSIEQGFKKQVTALTDDYTLTLSDCGKTFTNTGAAKSLTITAGDDVCVAGFHFTVAATVGSYTIFVDPGAADQIMKVTDALGDRIAVWNMGSTATAEAMTTTEWHLVGQYGNILDGNPL